MFICRAVILFAFSWFIESSSSLYLVTIVLRTKYVEKNNQWLKVDDFLPGDKIQTRNSVFHRIFTFHNSSIMWSVKLHIYCSLRGKVLIFGLGPCQ